MSSAVSAHPPGGLKDPGPASGKDEQKAHALGLTSATSLVVGTVVGAGVFTMPAVLAGAGTLSLVVLAVIALGAMILAVLFGQLTKRVPNADGGLYAYARHEFGDFAGYLTGWCYWIQAWAGNAAIVSSWVFYVDALFGINPSGIENWLIALVGLWIPAAINLGGLKQTAWIQNITVVLKYLPLLFVAVVGWFFVSKANFGAFNASGGGLYNAIGIAAGVALFSFIGVETASARSSRTVPGPGSWSPRWLRPPGSARSSAGPWSPWPSRTCSRPAPSSPTWWRGTARSTSGC
ncbi:MAG TPA: amino acid permease [Streptosporangiaceae bacterium]|jgi:APA family basic amino acid/polyamine antiporter